MRPTVDLFHSQLGQNNPYWKPKQPTVDTIWPFGAGRRPVNRATMALIREPS